MRIAANGGDLFSHPMLRQSSVLALSKFMCISEAFCERHLDLLFTIMERDRDEAVSAPGMPNSCPRCVRVRAPAARPASRVGFLPRAYCGGAQAHICWARGVDRRVLSGNDPPRQAPVWTASKEHVS